MDPRLVFSYMFVLYHQSRRGVNAGDCAPRWYPEKDSPVCVCNCSYCDSIEPIGDVDENTVIIYMSTQSGLRMNRSTISKGLPTGNEEANILIDPFTTFQTINGFGGTINDNAAYNIKSLENVTCSNRTLKDVLMREYFSADGIGYTLMRCPIGSNDGSTRLYTYADTPDDFDLVHFRLQREDIDMKIPIIQQAQSLTTHPLRIVASSWSAPAWMKRCNNLTGNGFTDFPFKRMLKGSPCNGSEDNKYYETWANYLVRFLKTYQEHNISVWALTTQNEPVSGHAIKWQSQVYYPWTERDFIKCHLGPAMSNASVETKLFIFDDNRFPGMPRWVENVCSDPDAGKYVHGVALHWFMDAFIRPDQLDQLRSLCGGDLELLNTEAYGYRFYLLYLFGLLPAPTGWPSFGQWQMVPDHANAMIKDLNHNVTGWIEWALATDTEGGPQWIGTIDSAVIVNASAGEFYKQPLFYAVAHFSKFVPRGSKRIATTFPNPLPNDMNAVAFLRPDGLKVVVIVTEVGHDVVLSLSVSGPSSQQNTASFTVLDRSITTMIFR